jgi:hypothetical protein
MFLAATAGVVVPRPRADVRLAITPPRSARQALTSAMHRPACYSDLSLSLCLHVRAAAS